MCEWLCGAAAAQAADWCDVSLVCGGRTIGAHRAVLASVSAFMKKLLISCHDDDSPTLIVLPEFELDSMLSVLFYIYNGEVVVPRSRVESFLNIIIALKIYVDKQVLDNIQKDLQGLTDKFRVIEMNSNEVSKSLHAPKISLNLPSDMDDNSIITIKRNSHSPSRHDVENTFKLLERYKSLSQKLYTEKLQSQHKDRQKKSLRRESFTETYPRNGNSNGLSAGVLVIPNEANLDTTSEFLMNANDNSRCVDALTAATDAAADTCADVISDEKARSTVEIMKENTNKLKIRPKNYQRDKLSEKNTQATIAMTPPMLELPNRVIKKNVYLDLRSTENILSSALAQHDKIYTNQEKPLENVDRCCATTKATISNRVMQSPWCPQLPISYRPFRIKPQSKKPESTSNDTNNNIDSPTEHSGNVLLTNTVSAEITEGEKQLPETVPESTELKCHICCQRYPDSDLLAIHMKCHASTARFTCSDCGKTFSQLRNYKYHMSLHRGTREFAATCTVCGKYFNDRGYLSSHMKIHRNRKEYKCQLCPKSFNQRVAYNMHVRIHTGVKPHVCEECGKAFSRKMLLKQHQRTHSGERPYACPHCEKRFADRSNMTLHLRLHTGVKPFSCTLCPKSFTKKHHLKSHLNFHTGAKPYACPRCHLAFTQSSNMRTHLKKCTN